MKTIRKTLMTLSFSALSTLMFAQSDSAALFLQKGREEKQKSHKPQALKLFETAYHYDSTDKTILNELAVAYYDLRRYEQSRKTFIKLEQLGDQTPATLKQIMRLSFDMRKFDDAVKYGNLLKKADPSERVNYFIGKANYEQEYFGDAIKFLDAAAKEEPANAEIPYMIARSYADMMNYKQSVVYFQRALAIEPGHSRWIYEMSLMYYGMRDDANTLKYMLEAGEKGWKRDNEYLENLGIAYLNIKKYDKGLEILNELLNRRPSDKYLLNMVAEAMYEAKKYDEAIRYWDQILVLEKTNAPALYMIGLSYQKKGQKGKGTILCDKAIQMDPSLAIHKKKIEMPM